MQAGDNVINGEAGRNPTEISVSGESASALLLT